MQRTTLLGLACLVGLALATPAQAGDATQVGAPGFHLGDSANDVPPTPSAPRGDSDPNPGATTYHTGIIFQPTRASSEYVLWTVVLANIRGHGRATSYDVGDTSHAAETAWGRDQVTITVPHSEETEEVVQLDVTNRIDLFASWHVDAGFGNSLFTQLSAMDIDGGTHRLTVNEVVDVAAVENTVESSSHIVRGSYQRAGGSEVGIEASSSGEAQAEASATSSSEGSIDGEADGSLMVDRTTDKSGAQFGTATYGTVVSHQVNEPVWTGQVVSWSVLDVRAQSALSDVTSVSELSLGTIVNKVTGVGWVRARPRTPPGDGGDGPTTPGDPGDGPSTPDGDEGDAPTTPPEPEAEPGNDPMPEPDPAPAGDDAEEGSEPPPDLGGSPGGTDDPAPDDDSGEDLVGGSDTPSSDTDGETPPPPPEPGTDADDGADGGADEPGLDRPFGGGGNVSSTSGTLNR